MEKLELSMTADGLSNSTDILKHNLAVSEVKHKRITQPSNSTLSIYPPKKICLHEAFHTNV